MNDEASVHYEATIDQMTEGHTFLLQEFGVTPRIGWQIGKSPTIYFYLSLFFSQEFFYWLSARMAHCCIVPSFISFRSLRTRIWIR